MATDGLKWKHLLWEDNHHRWQTHSSTDGTESITYTIDSIPSPFGARVTLTVAHDSFFLPRDHYEKRYDVPTIGEAQLLAQHLESKIA